LPSFDVVSEVNAHELSNSVDQTQREIANRFDFKGTSAAIEQKDNTITIVGESDFQLDQIISVLHNKMAKRGLDISSLEPGKIETAGTSVKREVVVRQGIDKELAKKITKLVKESKVKVQAAIQGEQVRVTGKNRDDLQQIIALLRESNLGIPLQYVNFRD